VFKAPISLESFILQNNTRMKLNKHAIDAEVARNKGIFVLILCFERVSKILRYAIMWDQI
jgi:hypothetical protein